MSHISAAHMVTDRKVRDEQTVDDTMTHSSCGKNKIIWLHYINQLPYGFILSAVNV